MYQDIFSETHHVRSNGQYKNKEFLFHSLIAN